jgi:hypothetical protein
LIGTKKRSRRQCLASQESTLISYAKNVKTLWREAEKLLGDDTVLQAVDPLT